MSERKGLCGMLLLAFALRAVAGLASPNLHWPDEIFQTLEPAHRLVFGYGVVTWEWRTGARSWLLPGFLAGVMRISAPLAPGSGGYLLGTTLVLAAIGTLPVWAAWRIARSLTGAGAALLAAFACAIWSELVYFAPKAMNEVVAGNLLAAACAFAPATREPPTRNRLTVCGALFGLAVALRPHLAPGVLAGVAWIVRRQPRRLAPALLAGAAAVLAFAGLLDALTWGTPFHSYFRNPIENLVVGRAQRFGVEPVYAYLKSYLRTWAFAGIPIVALCAWGARRHALPLLIAAVTLLVHSAIPHKEHRFLEPVSVLVILAAAVSSAELAAWLARAHPARRWRVLLLGALAWTLASLAVAPRLSTQHMVGADRGSEDPVYWRRYAGVPLSFDTLSRRADVCGVALLRLGFAFSGGYTHLHHDVPLFEIWRVQDVASWQPHANFLLARGVDAPRLEEYQREQCWGTLCLYRRPGGCEPRPGYDLNRELAARDQ
jgi:hypothetical protein